MKSSTVAAIIVGLIILLGAGVFVLTREDDSTVSSRVNETATTTQQERATDNTSTEESSVSDLAGPITTEQVALHATEDDCWTIIDGSVYDITSYIPRHPGGDNILSACGVDATDFFNGQKTGQNGGSNDHSSDSDALRQLGSLKIGELAE